MTENIFIVDGLRTPIGGIGQSLKDVSPIHLGAIVLKALLKKNGIKKSSLDELILGNVVSAGLGQNPARQSLVDSGLPLAIPAFTVNKVCGSGLKSVILAAQAILCGDANLVIAGGIESASQAPYILPRNNKFEELNLEEAKDALTSDGLWCNLNHTNMGTIAEYTAKQFKISREEQDIYALKSHQKAVLAQKQGAFKREIIPVNINGRDILVKDEKPRNNISLERLSSILPAFKAKTGTVTAGNSSAPADGAAALILASKNAINKNKLKPLARIIGYSTVALAPKLVFTAPALAIRKCLKVSSLKISDVDLFEVNEAFSVQALLTIKHANLDTKRLNILGGTLALGHPLGVSGARGLVTLINALKQRKKKIGLTSVCLGGGCALALLVEMV